MDDTIWGLIGALFSVGIGFVIYSDDRFRSTFDKRCELIAIQYEGMIDSLIPQLSEKLQAKQSGEWAETDDHKYRNMVLELGNFGKNFKFYHLLPVSESINLEKIGRNIIIGTVLFCICIYVSNIDNSELAVDLLYLSIIVFGFSAINRVIRHFQIRTRIKENELRIRDGREPSED